MDQFNEDEELVLAASKRQLVKIQHHQEKIRIRQEGKEEGESFFFFVYIGGGDPERGFHCQAYEDDRACCRTDIHIYR